jgi:ABC transporter DrrB family efflux protein
MTVVPLTPRSTVNAPLAPVRTLGPRAFVRDTALITRRHLLRTWRTPQLMVLAAFMPIMFVLLFRYVFGGSIAVPGYKSYVDYLIPGVIVQTVVFGGSSTAVGLADDLSKGLTDRFRSLPTHRASILAARTLADVIRLTYTMALLIGVGVLVGFRVHTDPLSVAAGLGIAVLFGAACSWLFALLALTVRHTETAQLAAFVVTFPFVFAASTFTSTATMPSWLQAFADHQPVTKVVNAVRALLEGSMPAGGAALSAVLWCVGLGLVAAVLATWRFRRMS